MQEESQLVVLIPGPELRPTCAEGSGRQPSTICIFEKAGEIGEKAFRLLAIDKAAVSAAGTILRARIAEIGQIRIRDIWDVSRL